MKIINEFCLVKDKKIECVLIKSDNKTSLSPLVLLHEGLGSVALWKNFPEVLSNFLQRDILVYSRIGMGNSAPIEGKREINFMHDEALIYLKNIIENYCDKEPVLFGHSDGASISIIYAGSNLPLQSLILEAPHVMVEEITTKEIKKLFESWSSTNLKSKLERYHKNVDSSFNEWCAIWLSNNFKEWNIESYIKNINVPVLAIQGLNDQYGSLYHIEALEKNVQNIFEKVLIDKCKHSPHLEFESLVLKKVKNFLTKIN